MSAPIYAEVATRHLRDAADAEEKLAAETSSLREEETIRLMADALVRTRRRAALVKIGAGVGSLSVAAAVAFVAVRVVTPHETARTNGVEAPSPSWAIEGHVLSSAGSESSGALKLGEPVTAMGDAHVRYPSGTEVLLRDRSETSLVQGGKANVFVLFRGSLEAKVAKLGQDERFVVRTSDAEFEVRGTRFEVTTASPSACATSTRLRVSEGVVAARHGGQEVLVHAGETWPSSCAEDIEDGIDPASLGTFPRPASSLEGTKHVSGGASKRPQTASKVSTLDEENDLFADAVAAKRNGDAVVAVRTLNQLLLRYPGSPLRESAEIERLRILSSTNHKEAASAARRYLARYPNGSARREAERIAAGTP